jgi:hypothetical protein
MAFISFSIFWDVIKTDLMSLVNSFVKGQLNLDRLNYGITLIPIDT